ncbi:putative MFS polyamine transporter [Myriangium duriaei CBS 260.36]|uniref:MFS polyamine transporter n=1 Tax=Myriangium duriaei CBS 260.36 TaxID=1168546 RepID=A0A9P4IYA3_9PEZI|nr:putative MFS polyamine transporter [Myriangium duriaei CBS 260.36]
MATENIPPPPLDTPEEGDGHSDLEAAKVEDWSAKAWDDPTETRNPENWSTWSKAFHSITPCFLAFLITLSTSVTVPAVGDIEAHFNVSRTVAILPLTLYTIGIAFGPAFIAPLSEVVGRKIVFVGTMTCFLAFTAGAGAAQNFETLLICRFLASFLGAAGVAMGGATITDVWGMSEARSVVALFFILGPFLGPTLGPMVGAYILYHHENDWRWTQWIILMVAAPVAVALAVMKETSRAWITRKESRTPTTAKLSATIRIALVRPIMMLLTDPIVLSLTIYTAFAYAVIFSYFASSSYILTSLYGFNFRQVGLSFIAIVIGYVLAAIFYGVVDKVSLRRALRRNPDVYPDPERRLYTSVAGSFFIPIGLFWYSWEAHRGGHWAAVVASGIPLGFGSFTLFLSAITYLVDIYRAKAAASALAANGTLRYTLGAVFPLFTLQMYQNLGVHWAGSVFAFLSVLLLPIPWLLIVYGSRLRQRSPFIPNDSN